MLFSQRKGYIKAKDVIQIEFLDEPTKNLLWSCLYENVVIAHYNFRQESYFQGLEDEVSSIELFVKDVWNSIFKLPIDSIPYDKEEGIERIRNKFFHDEWFIVFDIIEIAYLHLPNQKSEDPKHQFSLEGMYQHEINRILTQENAGYRMVDGKIVQATDKIEVDEIDLAIKTAYDPVRNHLQQALKFLTDRKNPSFRNSIKESISALEALVRIKIGVKGKVRLGTLFKQLNLHSSLQAGLSKIYGYASDADGIRHALSEESTVDYEDAKFFLVLSSAFVNFIEAKQNEPN